MSDEIVFGVRIQTYNRVKPKLIAEYVAQAIECVKKQTYPHWKIFLTGDCYEPRSEFKKLASLVPKDKIVAANLPRAVEREIHKGYDLWCCGGVTAINFTLDLMNELDISYCANLDDDDIWFPNHLEVHANAYRTMQPKPVAVVTHGHFKVQNYLLPFFKETDASGRIRVPTIAANSCNCACSWNIREIPLRAFNCIQETPWAKQCWDYWFWRQFEHKARMEGKNMAILPDVTVFQRHTHIKSMAEGNV